MDALSARNRAKSQEEHDEEMMRFVFYVLRMNAVLSKKDKELDRVEGVSRNSSGMTKDAILAQVDEAF